MRKSGWAVYGGVAVAGAALAVVLSAPASPEGDHGDAASTGHLFSLADAPEEAASLGWVPWVYEATVLSADTMRHVEIEAAGIGYTYVPVRVRVDQVHRGDLRVGETAVVRNLNGGGDAAVRFHGAPRGEAFEVGNRLLVFGPEALDVGDGLVASTPTLLYVIDDGMARSASSHGHAESIDIEAFRSLLADH